MEEAADAAGWASNRASRFWTLAQVTFLQDEINKIRWSSENQEHSSSIPWDVEAQAWREIHLWDASSRALAVRHYFLLRTRFCRSEDVRRKVAQG